MDLRLASPRARAVAFAVAAALAASEVGAEAGPDLTSLSLEDLGRVEVTSVGRKSQTIESAPAAVFVLTNEDIRRSGATTLPDLLRVVPGMHVAQVGGRSVGVSARGFNSRFANRMQVLLDGRTIYSPLFAGTIWESVDVPMEDIERVEVIRGPGGVVWGANAANGVINIITRHSNRTQGSSASLVAGTDTRYIGTVRHGGEIGEGNTYRLWARSRDDRGSFAPNEERLNDTTRSDRVGFRADLTPNASDQIFLAGEVAETKAREFYSIPSLTPPYNNVNLIDQPIATGHVLARWTRQLAGGSEVRLQSSFERSRFGAPGIFLERRDTVDIDATHRWLWRSGHDLVWGFNFRDVRDDIEDSDFVRLNQRRRQSQLAAVFFQNETEVVRDRLKSIVGLRYEHYSGIGSEPQPNLRLLWTPAANHTVWAGASRAVKIPSRVEQDGVFRGFVVPPSTAQNASPFPLLFTLGLADSIRPERVTAFELGYRWRLAPSASLDLAAFQNEYTKLRTDRTGDVSVGAPTFVPSVPPYLEVATRSAYTGTLTSRGLEASLEWRHSQGWRTQTSYTLFSYVKPELPTIQQDAPRQQLMLRSLWDVTGSTQLDATLRYVGSLQGGTVPAYLTADLRLGYRITRNVDVSLVGRNLLDAYHPEFSAEAVTFGVPRRQIGRSGFVQINWRF